MAKSAVNVEVVFHAKGQDSLVARLNKAVLSAKAAAGRGTFSTEFYHQYFDGVRGIAGQPDATVTMGDLTLAVKVYGNRNATYQFNVGFPSEDTVIDFSGIIDITAERAPTDAERMFGATEVPPKLKVTVFYPAHFARAPMTELAGKIAAALLS